MIGASSIAVLEAACFGEESERFGDASIFSSTELDLAAYLAVGELRAISAGSLEIVWGEAGTSAGTVSLSQPDLLTNLSRPCSLILVIDAARAPLGTLSLS